MSAIWIGPPKHVKREKGRSRMRREARTIYRRRKPAGQIVTMEDGAGVRWYELRAKGDPGALEYRFLFLAIRAARRLLA
jgi:hypothetical protein